MANLYLVSTPIGNLSDVTLRARKVLASVARIYSEDTRRTRILLDHLDLGTPLTSLHSRNEASRVGEALERLEEGEEIAIVSDAGTPLVSDPGERVVRAAIERGHGVVPVPGPSALLAALVASGLPSGRFAFLGFPPRRGSARSALLRRVAEGAETAILFESPGRLSALLVELAPLCGGDRRVAVAREMTKIHEEFFRGTIEDACRYYGETPPRGEVTLVVEGAPAAAEPDSIDRAAAAALARALLAEGGRPSRIAGEVARRLGIPRNLAYRIVQSLAE